MIIHDYDTQTGEARLSSNENNGNGRQISPDRVDRWRIRDYNHIKE